MSDVPQGDGWWVASDGRWYPPHLHPDASKRATQDAEDDHGPPAPGWWLASDGHYYAPELHPDYVAASKELALAAHATNGTHVSRNGAHAGNGANGAGSTSNGHGNGLPLGSVSGPGAASVLAAHQPGGWRLGHTAPPVTFHGAVGYLAEPKEPGDFFDARHTFLHHRPGENQSPDRPPGVDGTVLVGLPPLPPLRGIGGRKLAALVAAIVLVVIGGVTAAIVVTQNGGSISPAQNRAEARRVEFHLADMPVGWALPPDTISAANSSGGIELGSTSSPPSACRSIASPAKVVGTGQVPDAVNVTSRFQAGLGNGSPLQQLSDSVVMLASQSDAQVEFNQLRVLDTTAGMRCLAAIARRTNLASAGAVAFSLTPVIPHLVSPNASGIGVMLHGTVTMHGVAVPIASEVLIATVRQAVLIVSYDSYGGSTLGPGTVSQLTQELIGRIERYTP